MSPTEMQQGASSVSLGAQEPLIISLLYFSWHPSHCPTTFNLEIAVLSNRREGKGNKKTEIAHMVIFQAMKTANGNADRCPIC